jgi:hypothetical protein
LEITKISKKDLSKAVEVIRSLGIEEKSGIRL